MCGGGGERAGGACALSLSLEASFRSPRLDSPAAFFFSYVRAAPDKPPHPTNGVGNFCNGDSYPRRTLLTSAGVIAKHAALETSRLAEVGCFFLWRGGRRAPFREPSRPPRRAHVSLPWSLSNPLSHAKVRESDASTHTSILLLPDHARLHHFFIGSLLTTARAPQSRVNHHHHHSLLSLWLD